MPRITLARAYTDTTGRTHKADKTVDLPRAEAANLLHLGLARPAPAARRAPRPAPRPAPTPTPEPEQTTLTPETEGE